ncbi:MAG: type II toxin-antitoxin system HipA family toxin [Rhizobiales bacterium]|nr:type II toxin-antitoxin system HipA family toxin [Hyphomicrobiales bacterium]
MNKISILNVKLHGNIIGTITLLPSDKSIFSFTEEYIDNNDRDTLSLSFKDEFGNLLTDHRATGPNLLPFFSNLLPEGILRKYLAEQAGVKQVRELYLLWTLGRDLSGAITIEPLDAEEWPKLSADETEAEIKQRKDKALKFSLAGVQLKFSAFNERNGGITIPAEGDGGSWIVKLPDSRFDGVPENEFSFMKIAKKVGINVPEIELINTENIQGLPNGLGRIQGEKSFIIKRFDRSDEGLIHIEDFAQVFGRYPEEKYKTASYRNIAYVLGIETSQQDVSEFIRRLVYSTLIGNDDMHLKNWSLIYYDKRNASLSPAYDLLSTIAYIPSDEAALKYARTNKMSELNLAELAYLADKSRLPEKLVLDTARQTVSEFLDVWEQEKNNLYLPKQVIKTVDSHIKTLAIVREM